MITIARKKQQVNLYIKENIAILYKYLTKLYGEDNATKLISENENNLFGRNGLAVQLGAICFEFFNYYFLQDHLVGDDKAELSETHHQIWAELEDSILNINGNRREYIISRGFGKSSIISEPLAIWCALYNYSIYTVISSSIGSTAEQFIAEIKSILEGNEYIKQGFGEVINKKLKNNTEELELDTRPKKTMIKSISANSSFRGTRYGANRINLLLLDDYQILKIKILKQLLLIRFERGCFVFFREHPQRPSSPPTPHKK